MKQVKFMVAKTKDAYSAYKEGWYAKRHEAVSVYKREVQ